MQVRAPTSTAADRPRGLSIRTLLLSAIAGMSVIAAAALALPAMGSLRSLDAAEAARAADAGTSQFGAAVVEILLERLATLTALQAPAPATGAVREEIAQRRSGMAARFAPGMAALTSQDFAGKEALLAGLREATAQADAMRQRADAALALPAAQRDPALQRDYAPAIAASVEAAARLWFTAARALAAEDAHLLLLSMAKELGWRLRDTAGLERTTIAAALTAGGPVSAERLQAIAVYRGRIDQLWDQLQRLMPAQAAQTPAVLRSAYAAAERDYFQGFRPLADRILAQGATGQYDIAPAGFVTTSSGQLDSLMGLVEAANQASQAVASATVESRRAELIGELAALLVMLAIAGGSFWLVQRRVLGPLRDLTAATQKLASGVLATQVGHTGRGDEIGALARAVQIFRTGLAERETLRQSQDQTRAQADSLRETTVRAMADRIEQELQGAARDMEKHGATMARDAEAIGQVTGAVTGSSEAVADAARRALNDAESVAHATDHLAQGIRNVTAQVGGASAAARRAVERSETSQVTISGLAEAAERISDVVRLINDIAGRTNLLALNATIEAARAGEAGKGFAVVASEVKALASQTAKATEDIARQVGEIGVATNSAVAAVGEITAAIRETDDASAAIAAAMQEQAAATAEIAHGVSRTAEAAREVSLRIAEVSSTAMQAGERVTAMRGSATQAVTSIGALSASLVRILRTESKESNRRSDERFDLKGNVHVSLAGGAQLKAQLVNLSRGGAFLHFPADTTVRIKPSIQGSMRIDGSTIGLTFTVLAVQPPMQGAPKTLRGLRVQFKENDAISMKELDNLLAKASHDVKRAA